MCPVEAVAPTATSELADFPAELERLRRTPPEFVAFEFTVPLVGADWPRDPTMHFLGRVGLNAIALLPLRG